LDFIPHTPEDIREMLTVIGVERVEELFSDIPLHLRLSRLLDLPSPLTEQELTRKMEAIREGNRLPGLCLTGAGAYHHYIPAAVRHLIGRSEFYTAYTPYQAEISQGILQAIYEYQTMVLSLTGMEVTNASMYDGATAMAEACLMAIKMNNLPQIIVSRAVHPEYRKVLMTYAGAYGCEVKEAPFGGDGRTDLRALETLVGKETAVLVIQNPNFFGVLEDLAALCQLKRMKGVLLSVVFTEALSLALLKSPGQMGADLVAGEGQSFGIPLNYGGPYLGILAATRAFIRRMPGRIVGATKDGEGKRGYVLTLQAREQHIRREKATSNICSNETLCALAASIYLSLMGKNLKKLAELNVKRAHYLMKRLSELKGWGRMFNTPFFNEFVMRTPDSREVMERLQGAGVMGGYPLDGDYPELKGGIIFCVTEMVTRREMDWVVSLLERG